MLEKTPAFFIAWGDPSVAALYCTSALRGDDVRRAVLPRSRKAQRDWQVSRALRYRVCADSDAQIDSLSHKSGHAVCAVVPRGWRVGVDMERIKARDVMRLAAWVCSAQEQQTLARLSDRRRLEHFYLLWTLKEAFIKAAGLVFPADMARVGLKADGSLRAPSERWQACVWQIEPDWLVAMVWQAPIATGELPQWYAPATYPLPHQRVLGQWSV